MFRNKEINQFKQTKHRLKFGEDCSQFSLLFVKNGNFIEEFISGCDKLD